MQRSFLFLAALTLLIAVQTIDANAAFGDLDLTFGTAGIATDNVNGHEPRSVALQPDGKILVTGYKTTHFGTDSFFLRRYLSNGQIDMSFGTNGAAIAPAPLPSVYEYRGIEIVVQANGKIAVVGGRNGQPAVWQFHPDGKPDKTFDTDGLKILTDYSTAPYDYPQISIQDEKLLLSIAKDMGPAFKLALVRLTASGALDTSFGTAGESLTNFNAQNHYRATVVERSGKITLVGYRYHNQTLKGFERKLANGQPDPDFDAPLYSSTGAVPTRMVRMRSGKYAVTQFDFGPGSSVPIFLLEKFSTGGLFESNVEPFVPTSNPTCPQLLASQSDGSVIGTVGLLFRMNSELDPASLETTNCPDLAGRTLFAEAAVRPDDKIVAAGTYNGNMFLTRLLSN